MLIIEGKLNKIKTVSEILEKENNDNVLFINGTGSNFTETVLKKPVGYILTTISPLNEIVDGILKKSADFGRFEIIVFYFNCKLEEADSIKKIERQLQNQGKLKHCIVTVQNNELEEIKTYSL